MVQSAAEGSPGADQGGGEAMMYVEDPRITARRNFCVLLLKWKKQTKKTMKDFARESGIEYSMVRNIVHGRRGMGIESVWKAAACMEIPVEVFFRRSLTAQPKQMKRTAQTLQTEQSEQKGETDNAV